MTRGLGMTVSIATPVVWRAIIAKSLNGKRRQVTVECGLIQR